LLYLGRSVASFAQQARHAGSLETDRGPFGVVLVIEVCLARRLDDGLVLG